MAGNIRALKDLKQRGTWQLVCAGVPQVLQWNKSNGSIHCLRGAPGFRLNELSTILWFKSEKDEKEVEEVEMLGRVKGKVEEDSQRDGPVGFQAACLSM